MRSVAPFLAVAAAFLIQTTLLPVLGIRQVAPDLVLAAVAAVALVVRPSAAIGWGAFGGLLQDSFSGGLLGMNGFSKPLVAFLLARMRADPLLRFSLPTTVALLFLVGASVVDAVVLWGLGAVAESAAVSREQWLALAFGAPITAASGLFLFRVLSRASGRGHLFGAGASAGGFREGASVRRPSRGAG